MAELTKTLPTGGSVELSRFTGKTVKNAFKEISERGADPGALIFTIITKVGKIDGKPITFDMLDKMKGKDVLFLQNEFSGTTSSMSKEERATKTATLAANQRLLPSGAIAEIEEFLGEHVRKAQQQISLMYKAKKDAGQQVDEDEDANIGTMLFVLIAMLCKVDGNGLVLEDLDEMDGFDVLALQGEFSAAFF